MNQVYQVSSPQKRRGFTLMEIMVVIIVIAVLASVAGPMIGSITDQGKASATRASMQNLKTAFVNFANDLGRYPHNEGALTNATFNGCWGELSAARVGAGCPFAEGAIASAANAWGNMGIVGSTYAKRWKGPYIDGNPEQFFVDSWSGVLNVFVEKKGIWIRSPGPDGTYLTSAAVSASTYKTDDNNDDIIMSIAKVKAWP